MIPIAIRSAVVVEGYHLSGPGLVVGRTHEAVPNFDVAFDDGRSGVNIPGEFVKPAPAQVVAVPFARAKRS